MADIFLIYGSCFLGGLLGLAFAMLIMPPKKLPTLLPVRVTSRPEANEWV